MTYYGQFWVANTCLHETAPGRLCNTKPEEIEGNNIRERNVGEWRVCFGEVHERHAQAFRATWLSFKHLVSEATVTLTKKEVNAIVVKYSKLTV